MSDTFKSLINSPYMNKLSNKTPFKILIYNGDVSLKATTMEAEYFVETLSNDLNALGSTRTAWNYKQPTSAGNTRVAGYRKVFNFNQNVVIELSTVKGAGSFVAVDRPGPALQMFANFIGSSSSVEIGKPIQFSMQRQPLKPEFQQPSIPPTLGSTPSSSISSTMAPSTSIASTTTAAPVTAPPPPTTTPVTGPSPPTTTPYSGPSPPTTTSGTGPTVPTTTPGTVPTTTSGSTPATSSQTGTNPTPSTAPASSTLTGSS
uniref:Uncharacterized protein n=1 Tax=Panagrolaimus sp. JU765 TaxID=591449 RepID=A0AC34RMV5_9BILA